MKGKMFSVQLIAVNFSTPKNQNQKQANESQEGKLKEYPTHSGFHCFITASSLQRVLAQTNCVFILNTTNISNTKYKTKNDKNPQTTT